MNLRKVNLWLRASVEKGCLRGSNFRNSENKLAVTYLLTPRGVEGRVRMTVWFLRLEFEEMEGEAELARSLKGTYD